MGFAWASAAQLIEPAEPSPSQLRGESTLSARVDAVIAAQDSGGPQGVLGVPALFAVVRLIAGAVNQLPVTVDGDGTPPVWLRHPRSTGAALDLYDLLQYVVTSMALRGSAHLLVTRLAGERLRLDALHPEHVRAQAKPGAVLDVEYRVDGKLQDRVPQNLWSKDEHGKWLHGPGPYLLPIPYLVTPDVPWGTCPVVEGASTFAGYRTVEGYAAELFDAGNYSGGLLTTEAPITPETAVRWQESWVANRQQRKIPVLGEGLKYEKTILNARDAMWLESRAYNASQIAQMYGVPNDIISQSLVGGASSLSYANAQDNDMRFRRNCLAQFTEQISDAVSTLLRPSSRVEFDYSQWESNTVEADDGNQA